MKDLLDLNCQSSRMDTIAQRRMLFVWSSLLVFFISSVVMFIISLSVCGSFQVKCSSYILSVVVFFIFIRELHQVIPSPE